MATKRGSGSGRKTKNEAAKQDADQIIKDLKLSTLYLYGAYEDMIRETDILPIGFDIYVLYENTYLSKSDAGTSLVEQGGADIKTEDAASVLFDKTKTLSSTDVFEDINTSREALGTFLDEEIVYYIGLAGEKNTIQRELSGYSEVTSIQEDGKNHGQFLCGLSVNANADRTQEQISSLAAVSYTHLKMR